MNVIPVIHLGLGPIGRSIARSVADNGWMESVGAVDADPIFADRLLPEVCDADLPPLSIVPDLIGTGADAGAVVLQATVSRMEAARPQLLAAIALGHHVVSTAEELVWLWDDHPQLAAEIDKAARKSGVAVLGVGVNPGFVMDFLPLVLTQTTDEIEGIHIKRVVNLSERRLALQRKMGVGEAPERVQELLDREMLGHVGLSNSVQMLAAGLNWRLDVLDVDSRPIIAAEPTECELGHISAGACIGVRQQVTGYVRGIPRIILDLTMQLDMEGGSHDEILLDSRQCMRLRLEGLQGDLATAALIVNHAQMMADLAPGLHTMLTAPLRPRPGLSSHTV